MIDRITEQPFCQTHVSGSFIVEKGNTSFCDGHGTRYWRFMAKGLKRKVEHFIETFDNDLRSNDKYHCYIDYGGCIGYRSFDTNNFKKAVNWMLERLKNYR
ncbi:MAG: hypothetical protein WAQ83_18065 [Saprospiraceae bacterium]